MCIIIERVFLINVKTMKKSKFTAKKIATLSVFVALGLITFLIENQFPPLLIPGARMGLANIFSFAALIMYSPLEGFLVVIIRTALGAIFAGNPSALLFSFTGGIVSMTLSSILLYAMYPKISVMAISVAAAVAHNITQNLVFVLESGTVNMFVNLPYLVLLGILSGSIVGGVILLIFKRIPQSVLEKAIDDRRNT